MIIRAYLVEPANIEAVIESLEEAMHALYPYTLFHKVSFILFRRLAEGKIDLETAKLSANKPDELERSLMLE